jgi:ribose 5-phosphate isomerase B
MFGVSQRSWELSIKPLMPVVTRLYRHVVCRGTAVCGQVAETVAAGEADEGMVCCWTGTGASIAANKVPGIRAALVHDAETARGARVWNHANVLALSLRATPIPVMREILDAWYETSFSEGEAQSDWNRQQIDRIRQLEGKYRQAKVKRS